MNDGVSLQIEQSSPETVSANTGPSVGFFAVGIVINLVLIVAFVIWALRQGKKK